MKNKGICPKCNSSNVIDSDRNLGTKVMYHRYVCLKCGFSELYANDKHLEQIKILAEKGKI